jgi:uncharacterized membrane protein
MTEDSLHFEAVIVPHRSLSARGMRRLLAVLCLLSGGTAAGFMWLGAWPVGGFAGLELVLAAFLFRLNARAVRESELVMLSDSGVRIVRTDQAGRRRESVLPAAWLSIRLLERAGQVPALTLVSRDISIEIGRALGESEKRDLAQALEAALERWRNPRFDNPQLRV